MPDATRFGRFRLVERLGVGGMGEVWHARVESGRGVESNLVLKRLLPEHARAPHLVAMLAAEARVCARLDHPGIVKVFEFGEIDGEPYLAMEKIDGWDLGTILDAYRAAERAVPDALLYQLGVELAEALAYAHDLADDAGRPLGIVHRDITPGNVMITRQGAVKLVDFGVHAIRDRRADERTATGIVRGTLSYMSPEQADGRTVDRRSDVFSLGVVLFEALTGHPLFRGADPLETLRLVREAEVPPAATLRPSVDPVFANVLATMLVRAVRDRCASCAEVARALRPLARAHDMDAAAVRAELATLALPGTDDRPPPRVGTELMPPPSPQPTWRPWLIAALITAAAALPYALHAR